MTAVFEILKENPVSVLIIGILLCVVAALIYRLLKKDIDNLDIRLSRDIGNLDIKLSQEIKHTRELLIAKLEPIQENLANHVTDTNKKIAALKQDMKEGHKLLKDHTDKRFEGIESKIDKIIDKISEIR